MPVVNRNHQHSGFLDTGGMQQVRPRGITVKHLQAEDPEPLKVFRVVVEYHGAMPGTQQYPVDHASKATDAGDDHLAFPVDFVGRQRLRTGEARSNDPVVEDEKDGSQQHRQGNDQQQLLGQCCRDDRAGNGKRQ